MPANDTRLIISAGPHDRTDCPIRFQLPSHGEDAVALLAADGAALPAQRLSTHEYAAVIPAAPANSSVEYHIRCRAEVRQTRNSEREARVHQNETGSIDLWVNGSLLTRYVYAPVPARPYFYPVFGPSGTALTRGYPMEPEVAGETQDHPHHRSIWIAHGDVNGTDNWSEEPGHGYTRHGTIEAIVSGAVAGGFETVSSWQTANGTHLLTQRLKATAWVTGPAVRLMDLEIDLVADQTDVNFGDTKEGGIISTRVASAIDVSRGGRITNSYGGVDEAETWGRASHWCDYSGTISDLPCGIAILDHPSSFRHPTPWHVRNYGLMTANPFGWSAFTSGRIDGNYRLPQGDTLRFRYRLVLHQGNAEQGGVSGHFINYACPPQVTITQV